MDTTNVSGKRLRSGDKRRISISDTAKDSDTEEEHYLDEDLPVLHDICPDDVFTHLPVISRLQPSINWLSTEKESKTHHLCDH